MPRLTKDQIAVIKNDYEEKGWSAYRIWIEHPRFNCTQRTVKQLIKKIKQTGSGERRKGSGRPVTVSTDSNTEEVEELIQSQEEEPGTHFSIREIAPHLEISKSSVHRIKKKSKINWFKRVSTPQMNSGCRERRVERSINLLNRFSPHSLPRLAFQDEKDFTLQVPTNRQNNRVYSRGLKRDIQPERLFHEGNKFMRKIMVSAIMTWKGMIGPFFVADKDIKVNSVSYLKHLKNDLIPALETLYPRNDFIFVQDSAPSHRAKIVQTFLKEKLKSRYVKNTEWPPSSPDVNPLDYFFWNELKEMVYKGRHCNPFADEEELCDRILEVWDECASKTKSIRKSIKQFLLRLRAVQTKDGGSIKTLFG
jgi:transposase